VFESQAEQQMNEALNLIDVAVEDGCALLVDYHMLTSVQIHI
jgi:hypothetical protein